MIKILGCWYSNNGIHPKIIENSLQSIKRASEASEASKKTDVNVVTCNWSAVNNNPFKEHITLYKMGVHLGIILQILRVFYEEEQRGKTYDAVCFLEHDVLYPPDYFDRVAQMFIDNPQAQVVSHMDYIGMNQTGWLEVTCRQEPMHQRSFRYGTAKKHMQVVLKEAVLNGNVILEGNQYSQVTWPFNGKEPSCHINHSKHFTSHFNCYAKDSKGIVEHPYWGNFRKYYPDGEKSMA